MPHVPVHPSAHKRHRQNLKRRARNRAVKAQVHTVVKSVNDALATGGEGVESALRNAMKVLGKAASKGVLHRNAAARKISRLAAKAGHVRSSESAG